MPEYKLIEIHSGETLSETSSKINEQTPDGWRIIGFNAVDRVDLVDDKRVFKLLYHVLIEKIE